MLRRRGERARLLRIRSGGSARLCVCRIRLHGSLYARLHIRLRTRSLCVCLYARRTRRRLLLRQNLFGRQKTCLFRRLRRLYFLRRALCRLPANRAEVPEKLRPAPSALHVPCSPLLQKISIPIITHYPPVKQNGFAADIF